MLTSIKRISLSTIIVIAHLFHIYVIRIMIIELKGNKQYLQGSKYMLVTGHCIVVVSILTWTRMTGSFLLELKQEF